MFILAVFLFNLLLIASDGANILSVLPSSSKSHFIYPNALLLELAASGHNVTVMSPFPIDNPPANYRTIDISEMKHELEGLSSSKVNMQMNLIAKIKFLYSKTLHMTNVTLRHPKMKQLLESDEKFDLIILDLFLTDALLGLSTVFDCPIVALSTNGPHTWVSEVLGTPRPASYVPHMYTDFIDRINLGKRLENEFFYYIEKILLKIFHLPNQEELFNEIFPESNRTFNDVRKNAVALTLVNAHFSISFPKPFLPNMIEVAGMQINEAEVKPLPDDIKEFIESAEHGVVYFSFGSNVKTSSLDPEKVAELVSALSNLKQKVIWKFDDESLPVDSTKILIRKWLPQYEILGHNNTKAFISHAGLLSCIEAVYFAKPVIAVPIFGDQPTNAKKLVKAKLGLHLDFFNFNGKSLEWAVEEITSNQIFAESMKEASQRFRDRPLTALETGKFWVEYVLRNNISHTRSSSLGMGFFELHNLDVYIINFTILVLMLSGPFYGLKKLLAALHNQIANRLKTKTT